MRRPFSEQKQMIEERGIVPGVTVSWNLMGQPRFQRYGCVLTIADRGLSNEPHAMVQVVGVNGNHWLCSSALTVRHDVDDAITADYHAVWEYKDATGVEVK